MFCVIEWCQRYFVIVGFVCWYAQALQLAGRHIRTLAIADGGKFGLVVSPDGRYMAVSYFSEDGQAVRVPHRG